MKLIIITLFLALPLNLYAEFRTWTNNKGKKITAEILNANENDVTFTLKKNKKIYTLPLSNFSENDQKYAADWLKNNAEKEQEMQESMFKFGDTTIEPGKVQHLAITVNAEDYPKVKKLNTKPYDMTMIVPKGFSPSKKNYTIVQVFIAGEANPGSAVNAYKNLVNQADCVLIAVHVVGYGSLIAERDMYRLLEEKWQIKSKAWPVAVFGFSGGAKSAGYGLSRVIYYGANGIGAYMTGINEDTTGTALRSGGFTSKMKRKYKNCAFWLSSGSTDTVATLAQHENVMKIMKKNRIKKLKLNTFTGGHTIYKGDHVEAINWMLSLQEASGS